jgi:ATP-binding cassette, subfamily B, heavy metal transporter
VRPSSFSSDLDAKPNWRVGLWLLPYLMEFKGRVILALLFLFGAKVANVAMPWALKLIVDDLDVKGVAAIAVPTALLLLYGALRFGSVFLGELRDAVFARVTERAMRRVGLKVFSHLHQLDLDFHLSRKTGGLSRDIERGTSGISFLLRFLLFNIAPTLLELVLVAAILFKQFSWSFSCVVLVSVAAYILFSIWVTEWRTQYVREANEQDNRSNTRAIDSLLNYETVKYFNNEEYEQREYDNHLRDWEISRLKNRLSLAALNSGQALIIAVAVTLMMLLAAHGVANDRLTLGDFVMVNAYMLQLFIPLNFLGFVYREIRQALINIERMFSLLGRRPAVMDRSDAVDFGQQKDYEPSKPIAVSFKHVSFAYDLNRPILKDVSFEVPAGHKVAIVGASGAGKSTIAKLLFRFYNPSSGAIALGKSDIAHFTLDSTRRLMGVVPQDTVLFNDSIYYNIAYGNPNASREQIEECARRARLEDFISSLPKGYDTIVGERGLKVSGGEKQRLAIARVLLKNPPILIFDEATSALDTHSEHLIAQALDDLAVKHTTIVIAHRLSTVMNADQIIVLDDGRVVERGTHSELLAINGRYAQLWMRQQQAMSGED